MEKMMFVLFPEDIVEHNKTRVQFANNVLMGREANEPFMSEQSFREILWFERPETLQYARTIFEFWAAAGTWINDAWERAQRVKVALPAFTNEEVRN